MKLIFIFYFFFAIYRVESQFSQCSTEENCIPFQECDELKKLTQKGFLTPHERDLLRSKQCNSVNRVAYVCCRGSNEPQIIPVTQAPVPENTQERFTQSYTQNSQPSNLKVKLPKAPECGVDGLGDRIFGGEATKIDEHPWVAQIQYQKPRNRIDSHCGGSLINQRYVITAAHCDRKVPKTWKLFQVRLGEWDTRTNPDCDEEHGERICNDEYIEVPVSDIIVHESYVPDSRHQRHDIALLRMSRTVVYTDYIRPICLPMDISLRSLDFTGDSLEVVGFGKTENEYSSNIKLKVALDAVAQNSCVSKYSQIGIIEGQMCAGGAPGRDSCNGDSGGPLIKYGNFAGSMVPYKMLVGLVSFGPKNCGTKDQPGVYTRVSEYMPWIESKIQP